MSSDAHPVAGFWTSLVRNLRAGLRLIALRPLAATDFVVSFDQLTALLVLTLALLAGFDWLYAEPGATFDPYGLWAWLYYIAGGVGACALIARVQHPVANTRALLVCVLAAAPYFIIAVGLLLLLPFVDSHWSVFLGVVGGVMIGVSVRAVGRMLGRVRVGSIVLVVVAVVGLPWFLQARLRIEPYLWLLPEADGEPAYVTEDRNAAESLLFEQPDRIADAVDQLLAERPGITDVYYLGFAGDGSQHVFRREALFAERMFANRYGSGRRSLELINDEADRASYPLATVSGLRYALQLIGERLDTDEDVLVLFITSHGSAEEGIEVSNGGLPLANLAPEDLREALESSGIRWRVVVVSACYAGIFLEPLESESTMVITAADAEHSSFGCDDQRNLTYFGEAFLRDALPGAPSLEAAFEKAKALIAERERSEGKTPSNPQMFVGAAMRRKLAELATHTPSAPEAAVPGTGITAAADVPLSPGWQDPVPSRVH